MFTGRTGDEYENLVAGVDGLYRFRESDSVRFQIMGSQSIYPDEIAEDYDQPLGEFDGQSYLLSYVHDSSLRKSAAQVSTTKRRSPGWNTIGGVSPVIGTTG